MLLRKPDLERVEQSCINLEVKILVFAALA
jgi:hypothetical protein